MDVYEDLEKLSKKYGVPLEDVLLIALNRYGIKGKFDDSRIRFHIKLPNLSEEFFLALGVNTGVTPFLLEDNQIKMEGRVIGTVSNIEKDTCTSTYFRKNKTEITLDSNSRSQCSGCKFCGSYKLDSEYSEALLETGRIRSYIDSLLLESDMRSLASLEGITVCTGCFKTEQDIINHLILLKKVLKEYGFEKKLKYIGSQIRSDEGLQRIKDEIADFSLFITTEKFTDRDKFMKREKASLDLEKTIDLIDRANSYGFETTILYILGLEDLETFKSNMQKLSDHVSKFPIVQIYQNYVQANEQYRIAEAKGVEYYLKARKILEEMFPEEDKKPESWENYRSLFYTKCKEKPHQSIRI